MKRILVVDDEVDVLTILSIALQMHDYEVATAGDGEEALAMLRAAAVEERPFDALLLDMAMPRVDGWYVLHQVRKDPALKNLPIIAVTGKVVSPEDIARIGVLGAIYVDKRNDYVERVLEVVKGLSGANG